MRGDIMPTVNAPTLPTVAPIPETAVLRLPAAYLNGADVVIITVYGKTVDYLRFTRQGDAFVPDGWR